MEVVVKSQPAANNVINSPAEGLLEPHLINFFSVDPSEITDREKEMLSDVSRYLSGKEPVDAINELRNIRFRLGTPQIGVSPLQHLHKYIKLTGQIKESEAQLHAMENA